MPAKPPVAITVSMVPSIRQQVLMMTMLVMMVCAAMTAQASNVVNSYIDSAEPVGQGRLTYFIWNVYDATLYASEGEFDETKPFALNLHYLRDIEGQKIADTSAEAIRQLGFEDEMKIAAWHSQMLRIFPDVKKGTELTGVFDPGKPTRFYMGDKEIGRVRDPEFGKWFFDIWLSEKTQKPQLRAKLLGR